MNDDGAPPAAFATEPRPRISPGGGVEVAFHLAGEVTRGRLSVVEHPMAPGALIHRYAAERRDADVVVRPGRLAASTVPNGAARNVHAARERIPDQFGAVQSPRNRR